MKTVIIDYGSGNLRSAQKAFERAAASAQMAMSVSLTSDPDEVDQADKIVLPGVGAYRDCRDGIRRLDGMWEAIEKAVIADYKPFFGICVGMQLMADVGLEHGSTDGFGWIKGRVEKMQPQDTSLKIPQMGWNTLDLHHNHPVMANIKTGPEGLHAYFVHSYQLVPEDDADLIATTDYGGPVTAIVATDNLVGTQFHPEKSQKLGLAMIENFLKWKC